MLKKAIINFAIFISIFFIFLIFTLPKDGIWFKFEELAYKKGLVIDGEDISSNPIFLNIKNGDIIFSGMHIASFDKINILPLLFYNSISLNNIKIGEDIQQFKELSMDNLNITYSAIFPTKLMLNGFGSFGELKGRINLQTNSIDLLIFPTERFKKVRIIMKHFKRHENGGFVYNARF